MEVLSSFMNDSQNPQNYHFASLVTVVSSAEQRLRRFLFPATLSLSLSLAMVFIQQPNRPHSYTPLHHKMVGLTSIPQWLEFLLAEKFFIPCLVHESDKKNEKNTFCLDCCISLCPHCLHPHQTHRLLQIRRYVYQDVVRLNDAQKLMDCSSVQAYITNNAKVVFLNQRPMTRQFKGSGNTCIVCDRNLQYPFLYCSISCKANQMGGNKVELNGVRIENSLELQNGQLTPDLVLELPVLTRTSSESSSSSGGGGGTSNFTRSTPLAFAATAEFVKKKRSSVFLSRSRCRPIRCTETAEFADAVNRRRKSVPHRSPLY